MSQVRVEALREDRPGARWQELLRRFWPSYRDWSRRHGDRGVPLETCERRLGEAMPELLPTYERLVELAGGGDEVRRFLSLYRPAPYVIGCSQAVWTEDEPALVRNYDYSPELWEGVLLASKWSDRRVIAMSDCLWGCLDGINEAGLAVSLAFGGRQVVGDGFGCPLIVRHLLETCDSADEAALRLLQARAHMAYNVTVVDAGGGFVSAALAPDRPVLLHRRRVTTNHQDEGDWPSYVNQTSSLERERFLEQRLAAPAGGLDDFGGAFLEPPLFSRDYEHAHGTLYTAIYRPRRREVEYRWQDARMVQSIDRFDERHVTASL